MMDVLEQLQALRQQIRAAVEKLTAEAELNPQAETALACVHLATECQKLDRLIALLSNEVLKEQPSEGTA